jgi:hypothetical protein
LVAPFYKQRYALYAEAKMEHLALISSGDAVPVDEDVVIGNAIESIVKWNCEFNRERWDNATLPSAPRGDPLVVARSMWTKYGKMI